MEPVITLILTNEMENILFNEGKSTKRPSCSMPSLPKKHPIVQTYELHSGTFGYDRFSFADTDVVNIFAVESARMCEK